MQKIVDVTMFNGEYDLFDLRWHILKDIVDEFIVCEARTTFSGKKKPLYFERIKNKYNKVKYFIIEDDYTNEEWVVALKSPNTRGAHHWKWEFLQKERIKQAIKHLKDDDIVFIGDCDEIWDITEFTKLEIPIKLKLKVYTYYLNQHSDEQFWGILMSKYRDIKNECLNHLRVKAWKTPVELGWHFTSLKDGLKRKLEDSYTKESYANDWVIDNLDKNIAESKDFLGRDFKYWVSEEDWPTYLRENREKYSHLLKK